MEDDCDEETVAKNCPEAAGLDLTHLLPVNGSKGTTDEPPWVEREVIGYGLRRWHIMFLSAAMIMGVVILLCCCFKFRIPRTKQEIEGDHIRRKILRKFRRKLKTIQNQELDDMDLKRDWQHQN